MAGKRVSATTQPQPRATANDKSVRQMMRAATKRARATRAVVIEGGGQQRGRGSSEVALCPLLP